jgi:hypothetical protein
LEYVFFAVTADEHSYIENYNDGYSDVRLTPDNSSYSDSNNRTKADDEFLPRLVIYDSRYRSQYYPDKSQYTINAVDDNPGCTSAKPYVYAAKRKYHDSGSGGA